LIHGRQQRSWALMAFPRPVLPTVRPFEQLLGNSVLRAIPANDRKICRPKDQAFLAGQPKNFLH
jgi:hypothetical protein